MRRERKTSISRKNLPRVEAVLLADMLAVSESTPGAIGVNMDTYVGYTTA